MKLAAIDIGTNSIHLVIVETVSGGAFEVVDREKTMVKLGAGLFAGGRLTDRAFNDGLETLRRYMKLAESQHVDSILAVATSATREAENGGEFIDSVKRETGLVPRVISGVEEGQLIFRAVRHALDLGDTRTLVLDIGGGSVEAVLGEHAEVLLSESMRLGVQRLLDFRGSQSALNAKQLAELSGYIKGVAGDVMRRAGRLGFSQLVGTSGTIRTLGEAAHLAAGGEPTRTLNAQKLKLKELEELTRRLIDLGPAERAKLPGIGEARSDAIHLGAVLLSTLMDLGGVRELTLCDASLREGVILDYIERHGGHFVPVKLEPDVRRHSVSELMEKYGRDDPREHHIARLALSLFDQTSALSGYGAEERELLEYAALLHGIGQHVAFRGRHKHTRYIIRHGKLRGFNDDEVDRIAAIARYHRGAEPKKKHKAFNRLEPAWRQRVRFLAGLLRIAVALDRGHAQLVRAVSAEAGDDGLSIKLGGRGDLELELWAARRKTGLLERALRRRVLIEYAPPGIALSQHLAS